MTQQLDFFDLLKPTATILPFPARRLTSLVEAAAQRVHAATPVKRPQALLNEVGRLMLRYMLNGIDESTAFQIAKGYEQAIMVEVHRLRWQGGGSNPKSFGGGQ